jgi:tetratricopeptide (TPR) repeat protein/transcriptional regulator with XRE-family HTH domain
MKKAKHAVPNQLLKEARELRGWSQKYVAEQIGADHYYLSRWERGTASPSPYYRAKLCTLFGLDARALGLVADAPARPEDAPAAPETAAPADQPPASAAIHDPTIPPPLGPAEDLLGREQLLPQLRAYLCADTTPGLIALYGLPGVGKTTLAVALAHDQAILDHFAEGILWAGLGPHPDTLALLNHWGTLLGVAESESQKLRTSEAWIRRLRAAIGSRRMLLMIDDAYEIEQALAFKVGGPRCAYVVTTRFPSLAHQLAGKGATQVKELSDQESVRLLARLAPQVVTDEPKTAQSLAQSVGGLPLALTLMGNYLRLQSFSGQPRRLRAAIERLRSGEERLRLTGPQALLERSPGQPEGYLISLEAVIDISEQQLPAEARDALRALSIFPAKPNSFSEEAALAVCQTPAETLDYLSDTSLLESQGPGRYTLHQTIADFAKARARQSDPAVPARLAAYFAAYAEAHQHDFDALSQELPNIFAALEAATAADQPESFVRCVNACFHFFFTRGLYAQEAGRSIEQAIAMARRLNDDTLLAIALLHQGQALFKQGKYAPAQQLLDEAHERASSVGDGWLLGEILLMLGNLARFRVSSEAAEQFFQQSLDLARQTRDPKQMSNALSNLGSIASDRGRYDEAITYQEQALAISRSIDDRQAMTKLNANLSSIAYLRGDLVTGEAYGQEALALARDIGFLDATSAVLTNMGSAAVDQHDFAKAESYLTDALDAARQIDDPKLMSVNLGNLGNLAFRQKRYEQATRYIEEALQIARQVGDIWLLGAVLVEWGELALEEHRLDDAAAAFDEALGIASKGSQEMVALARYGLARVAAERGDNATALEQGKESLAIFEAMGNRQTEEVKSWLQAISGEG